MESIKAELEVIRLIEEEIHYRKKEEYMYQLNRLKKLAQTIEDMIKTGESDYKVHKATIILCKYLSVLFQNIFSRV